MYLKIKVITTKTIEVDKDIRQLKLLNKSKYSAWKNSSSEVSYKIDSDTYSIISVIVPGLGAVDLAIDIEKDNDLLKIVEDYKEIMYNYSNLLTRYQHLKDKIKLINEIIHKEEL